MTHVAAASLFLSAQPAQPAAPDFAQRCQAAHGILFSSEMVLALLDGRKTQTRRVLSPGPMLDLATIMSDSYITCRQGEWVEHCPYGRPGDDLWVRETWHGEAQWNTWAPRDMVEGSCVWYAADGASNRPDVAGERVKGKTRTSIHMPRWACRTLLHITAVRLERLHDISEADAQAEGITAEQAEACGGYVPAFAALWERVHNTFWDAENPWVWVVEFEVVRR